MYMYLKELQKIRSARRVDEFPGFGNTDQWNYARGGEDPEVRARAADARACRGEEKRRSNR